MKLSIFKVVFTVFLLWLTIQLTYDIESYVAYFFLLTLGVFHGANDISLIHHINKERKISKFRYLFFYIVIVAIIAISFFVLPFIALVVFVFFSCYHFGEQHFNDQLYKTESTIITKLLYLSYGMVIFGLLFTLNSTETQQIIYELTSINVNYQYYYYFLIIGLIASVFCYAMSFKNFIEKPNFIQEIFLLLLFSLIFQLASIIWAFSIYFIVWHSLPSLKDQIEKLYGNFSKKTILAYVKSSMVYWIVSLIGLALLYFSSFYIDVQFVTLFFAFLAAITIPHVIVMYYLNKN